MVGAVTRVARVGVGVVVVGALAALGLGCSNNGESGDPSSPSGGGTMRVGVPGALVVDPTKASLASPSDQMVLDLLYDGLTSMDSEGLVQPDLAVSWEHNEDFTAWRFQLDPEARFSSGDSIMADDVIASIERVAALGTKSLAALALEPVVGFAAFVDGTSEHLEGLSAVNGEVVRFGLTEPLSMLPAVVASPVFGVVEPASLLAAADGLTTELDLSGSWVVVEAAKGDLKLEPRADTSMLLGAVELAAFSNANAAYDAFVDGEVDWATVPADRFESAVDTYGDESFAPFQAELFFGMNLGGAPLNNQVLRQAIEAAIDREAIVKAVYADLADPLATVIPVGVAGHDDARCGGCGPNPKRAVTLLAKEFPSGGIPTVSIDYDKSPAQTAMAKLIAADLEAVGIPTSLRPLPLDDYKAFVASGGQALFTFGWIGAFRSPDSYLTPLFVSDSDDNLTAFRSPEVDGLLQRARAADDDVVNAERWAKAEATVMDAVVVIPIAQFRTQVVVADEVSGWAHAVDGTVDWEQVTVTD